MSYLKNRAKPDHMKRILVPTDFSKFAYYAAEVAASIAKKTGARVFLLHAIEMPHYSSNDSFPVVVAAAGIKTSAVRMNWSDGKNCEHK